MLYNSLVSVMLFGFGVFAYSMYEPIEDNKTTGYHIHINNENGPFLFINPSGYYRLYYEKSFQATPNDKNGYLPEDKVKRISSYIQDFNFEKMENDGDVEVRVDGIIKRLNRNNGLVSLIMGELM